MLTGRVSCRREAELVVEIEINSQLTSDSIVVVLKATANYGLAFAADQLTPEVVGQILVTRQQPERGAKLFQS